MTVIQNKEPKKKGRMAMEFFKMDKILNITRNSMFSILFESEICMCECKANIDTPCLPSVSFVADVEAVD